MDAKELTKKYYDLDNKFAEDHKNVEFLMSENMKLRRMVEDAAVDIKMLQASIDALRRMIKK